MKKLHVAPGLDLPLDFVTQATAILAKRRVGKSYTARRIIEEVANAKIQIIVIDPKGDWWGSRSSADGSSGGLPLNIFGGEHKDFPLTPSSGETLAALAVEENVSMIVDLSEFRKHEVATFSAPFLETLYRLKAREAYRSPVLVAVDEGDAIAPQKPQPNEARMLGAAEDLVRRGGQRGIGTMFISQRSAVLNKNVLTQAQILVALKTTGRPDIDAMKAWIDVHGTPEQRKILIDSLPTLPIGDAWFWSPGWPSDAGIFQRVHVDPIRTFDSGATPKPGEKRRAPKVLAPVDRDRIRDLMAEHIEAVERNDPKALKTKIAELERQIATLERELAAEKTKTKTERIEVPARVDWPRLNQRLDDELKRAAEIIRNVLVDAEVIYQGKHVPDVLRPPVKTGPPVHPTSNPRQHPQAASAPRAQNGKSEVTGGLRRIMTALAQRPGLTNKQIGIRAGLSSKSGTFSTYMSRGRSNGWIHDIGESQRALTEAGLKALGAYSPLPQGRDLLAHWVQELGGGAARMLLALAETYPQPLSNAEIGALAGVSHESGTFSTYMSRLRTLELIEGNRGEIKLAEELAK